MPILTEIPQADFVADVRTLAAILARDDWTPHFIIGIGRGGLVPAVFLSHATGLPMLSVDYSSHVPDFAAEPLVKLAARSRTGERLLLVDDINDSGRTITALRAALSAARAAPGNVRIATLIDNIRSAERVDYAARAIDRDILKDWFVFPWEAVAPRDAIATDAAAVPERTA
jgi:hypoxanthine phosphoribosyltransferase